MDHLVKEWLRIDRNEATRSEIQELWEAGNEEELEKRMSLPFITYKGLRGRMEAGWSRMNDLIIIQASQGLCQYVLSHVKDAVSRGVVIGHDHRHNSEHWAQLTAATFLTSNVKVYLHRGLVHTPMVPFSVKKLNAACGVMITASHNPKQDNGYKVYWENAVQIIAPHDAGISESIKANLEPKTWDVANITSSNLCLDRTAQMKDAYFESLAPQRMSLSAGSAGTAFCVRFVNTSMHGVSEPFVSSAFKLFGLVPPTHVPEQQVPDPDFPTVTFPNPEEKGALDLAMKTAAKNNINYVLAQDPDSDRFAAAERQPTGEWIAFTGDQLGVLFAACILERYRRSGKPLDKLAMVASTVSSKMVEAMANVEGFKFVECLTGFKYIGNVALNLERQGYEVPFGYEEAIGYMFGPDIRDKDGVAATLVFAQLVESLVARQKTVNQYLNNLYKKYGHFVTSNSYFICSDSPTIDSIFARLRNFTESISESFNYPTEIAGMSVTRVVDLTTGYDSANPPKFKPSLPISSGHMVQFRAEDKEKGVKIALTIRTSGTEPKIKYYLEGNGYDREILVSTLRQVVDELGDKWLEAKNHNLGRP
ncbi:uncharacterized protein BT62DRAFT_959078 [Guyanagaster necrorhizus]|uniref:Phosphoglucomutase n=1 Tax=Guyanagaster necrorhizus TaxID=856835 RepID=A0A9P8AZ58_9AGAR|nr:uncharacterized protein BT62DRAFT_959078 [Guyanagaster necrorhizus MCA 3950]KAG7452946.1 hypothetical protein BT62DRAFT_959078 [Guyanagaster necrorhizus MCA 3950]